MINVFVDTDVILDLLADRKPHSGFSESLFSLAEKKQLKLYVSSLSFSNLFYILRKFGNTGTAYKALQMLQSLVSVLSVNEKIVKEALNSGFTDFEDALQYFTAKENEINYLITRNVKDYKKAQMKVLSADEFLKLKGLI